MSRFPPCFSSFIRFYLLFAAIDTTFLTTPRLEGLEDQRRSLPVAAMNGEIREKRVLTDSVADDEEAAGFHTGPSAKPKPHATADIAWSHYQRASKNLPIRLQLEFTFWLLPSATQGCQRNDRKEQDCRKCAFHLRLKPPPGFLLFVRLFAIVPRVSCIH